MRRGGGRIPLRLDRPRWCQGPDRRRDPCGCRSDAHTPWRTLATPDSTRLLGYDEVLDVVPDLYERVARWRVGSISRPAWMWPLILKEATQPLESLYGKGSFIAVHSDVDGNDDGYVYYEVTWDEQFAANPVGATGY